jgi:hypothetical protein
VTPTISVLITVWGDSPYFPEALRSAREQAGEVGSWEIVVLTNRPREIPAQAGGNPNAPPVRVVVHHDPIRGRFFGAGTRACQGKFISFLNDDDVWLPGKLEAVQRCIRDFPHAAYHRHQVEYFGGAGVRAPHLRRLHPVRGAGPSLLRRGPRGWPPDLGRYSLGFNDSSITIRRDVLERSYPFMGDMETSEDMFFLFAALASGEELISDPRVLSRYRIHGQNDSGSGSTSARASITPLHREFGVRARTYRVIEDMVKEVAPERTEVTRMAKRGTSLSSLLHSLTDLTSTRGELARCDLNLLSTWRAYQPRLDLALSATAALALLSRDLALQAIFRFGVQTSDDA